jgi:hypothetical protein
MARAVRVLLALVLSTPILLVSAGGCAACSCATESAQAMIDHADAAFAGRIVSQRGAPNGTIQILHVAAVYKGSIGPQVELIARIGEGVVGDCAVLLPTGSRVAVVADRNPDGSYSTSTCWLVRERTLRATAGTPTPPDPDIGLPVPSVPVPAASASVPWWLVALAGGAVGTALIAISLRAGRRREQRTDPPEDVTGDVEAEPAPGDPPA